MTGKVAHCERHEYEAAERLKTILAKPLPAKADDVGIIGADNTPTHFDPWDIINCVYGSYDSEFDKCAIAVLTEIKDVSRICRQDLGANMFREMLCVAGLCSYGTSPRGCFPTRFAAPLIPELITKWRAYSIVFWGEDLTI